MIDQQQGENNSILLSFSEHNLSLEVWKTKQNKKIRH